jgi:hypothetical protein
MDFRFQSADHDDFHDAADPHRARINQPLRIEAVGVGSFSA